MTQTPEIHPIVRRGPKVGLALGAGGVRGFAHLGVLEVLEREGIPVDVLAGSSAGAAMAAMYAFRPKAAPNLTHVREYLRSKLYDEAKLRYLKQSEESRRTFYDKLRVRIAQGAVLASSLSRPSLFDIDTLRANVQFLVAPVRIEEAFLPLGITAFDLITGEELVFTQGPLVDAVMASCAIPGVFPAVPLDDHQLMDGGIVNPVPVDVARRLGADIVIAIDVAPRPDPLPKLDSSYEVAMRAADISRLHLKRQRLRDADLVIEVDLSELFWGDFTRLEDCVTAGRQAAEAALPRIRKLLSGPTAAAGPAG